MLHRQRFAQNFVTTPFLGGSFFLCYTGKNLHKILWQPHLWEEVLTYTALTRVRKFDNLYFEPFYNFDRFDKDIRKQKMFIERIAHEKKEKESDDKFCDKLKTIDWYTDVAINPHGTD